MRYKSIKYVITFSILLLFIIVSSLPRGLADDDTYKYPFGMTERLTIFNETALKSEAFFYIYNPYEETKHININLSLPYEYTRGNSEVYGAYGNQWVPIPKNMSSLVIEVDISGYSSTEIIFRKKEYDKIELIDNKYGLMKNFTAFPFSFYKIEFRIPEKKGMEKIKIIDYNLPSTSEYLFNEWYVFRWEWMSSESFKDITAGEVYVIYTYEVPWEDYYVPFGWVIVGLILSITIPRGFKKIYLYLKKDGEMKEKTSK